MNDLSIILFGPPQITRNKQQITLQRRKDLALLVYLVVTAQPHTRDTLAALLWPDSEQSSARANVRKNISRLKSDLGEDAILTKGDQVSLNTELSLWLDVRHFQSLTGQPRKHDHTLEAGGQPLCETCQSALEEAVQLYRSEFLEGFNLTDSPTFDEWQFFQSEGYRQNLGEALQYLTQQYIYLNQYGPAIEHCRRWLSMDTLHEPAHRQLMLAYALDGQQAAAIRQFKECSRLLKEELGVEPEAATIDIFEAIRAKRFNQKVALSGNQPASPTSKQETTLPAQIHKDKHNLPVTTTPFIGRTKELNEIKTLFEEETCRVVTLIGPGGSGKTRLAIQAGTSLYQENKFKDGIWFMQLAPLTDLNSVITTVQKELNIPAIPGQENPRQYLITHLQNRQMLLILDNLEHLLNTDSIQLISDLTHHAPQTKILITSRERLNIQGERLFPVEGLETPSDETLLSSPEPASGQNAFSAVLLFEQCAQRVQPSFKVNNGNIKIVSQICQYVQGMPLAIELAAAWIEALPLEEIHKEVKQDLDFLRSELHDVPDRQRSLRVVFDSSWVKLSKSTRATIKALSVFRANFSREAAQAITGLSAKTLLELTNKSWIQPQKNGKYQIHELLRQFAFEKLECDPITYGQVKNHYCTYYNRHLSVLWGRMKGSNQSAIFAEMESEFENIKTAWNWLSMQGDYESAIDNILPVLFCYSEVRGKAFELMSMADQILKTLDNSPNDISQARAEIILRTAKGAFYSDGFPIREADYEGVYPFDRENIQTAWKISSEHVQTHELGFWGTILTFIYGIVIDHHAAIRQFQKTLSLFQENGDLWDISVAKLHLVQLSLEFKMGEGHSAIASSDQLLSDALKGFKALGDKINTAKALRQLGNLRMEEQKLHEAIREWNEAITILREQDVNEWSTASNIRWLIGEAYLQLGRFEDAFKCFEEIHRVNIENGYIQQAIGALSKVSFEKARYGSLTEALQMRQQCLDLVQKTGLDYQIAWNEWELGEIMRLSGRLDESLQWYEVSRKKFDAYQDNIGLAFYWRGMGDVALSREQLNVARDHYLRSVDLARKAQHNWVTTYSLNGLAKVELGLGNPSSAGLILMEGLEHARVSHDSGVTLALLLTTARYFVSQGKREAAVELGSLILSHFAAWNETRKFATELMLSLKYEFLPRKINELKNKGQSLDLWETVDMINDELQKTEFKWVIK